jgi:hypothetical protein
MVVVAMAGMASCLLLLLRPGAHDDGAVKECRS